MPITFSATVRPEEEDKLDDKKPLQCCLLVVFMIAKPLKLYFSLKGSIVAKESLCHYDEGVVDIEVKLDSGRVGVREQREV